MINKYEDGVIPALKPNVTVFDADLTSVAEDVVAKYHELMNNLQFSDALDQVWRLVARANKYIDETEPWVLAKDDTKADELASVMAHLAESLRVVALLIQPVMTHAPIQIFGQLGFDQTDSDQMQLAFGHLPEGAKVAEKGTPIFPRLDVEEEIAYIKDQMTPKLPDKVTVDEATRKEEIDFDTFDKSEIRVAEILNVEKVKKADKLLKFTLDAGDKGTRQILSGIAMYYPNFEELVGKR